MLEREIILKNYRLWKVAMMSRFITAVCSLSLTALISFGSASASGFNQFVGFGDSTMDTGYFRYHTSGTPLIDAALAMAIAHGLTGGWTCK